MPANPMASPFPMGTTATASTAMETTAIAGVNTITIRPIPADHPLGPKTLGSRGSTQNH